MPSYSCLHPTCTTILNAKGYCPQHQQQGEALDHAHEAQRNRWYDKHVRNPAAKKFYNSSAWKHPQHGARANKIALNPLCDRCAKDTVWIVHHIKPFDQCTPEEALDQTNLQGLCLSCHNIVHGEMGEDERPDVRGMLTLVEDDRYLFDEERANKVIRFVEKVLVHPEGPLRETPFLLTDIQKRIIRDIYGWIDRETNYRRFTDVWWEAAIGAGKSPTLAAIGLFELLAGGEHGAQIFSVASNFKQARIVFDAAKAFIDASPQLIALVKAGKLEVTQYEIRYKPNRSMWAIVSGKGPKAGFKPHLILCDEVHEWPTGAVYSSLRDRMKKRAQPLCICATNAGTSRQSFCWTLHVKAEAALMGRGDSTLYPIIWAAAPDAKPDDPSAWHDANKMIGVTMDEKKIAQTWEEKKSNAADVLDFRRLYLGQWVTSNAKWLDQSIYMDCAKGFDDSQIKDLPLYIAIDPSDGNDLFAVVYVWVSEARFFVRHQYWMIENHAKAYQLKDGIPYTTWADKKHITLLPGERITPAQKREIAEKIIATAKPYKVAHIGYDRARGEDAIAALEAAGQICVPVAQGWTLTPGCQELEGRLAERSITFEHNPVTAFCVENVEIKPPDDRGNYWPVKPNAKGRYAGTSHKKVDGVTALVTALTEARKYTFAKNDEWQGSVFLI